MRAINRAAKRGNKGTNQFERRMSFVERDLMSTIKNFIAKNSDENMTLGNCIQVNIISTNYIRDYGYIGFLTDGYLTDSWGNRISRRDRDKLLSIETILKNKPEYQAYYDIDWSNDSRVKKVYFTHAESEIITYSTYDFIKLPNGQFYDIENQYWFDIESSKELENWMAHDWDYVNPVDFLQEVYGD